jgi:CO/xanthine dehydrogenase Mo-binding subunit
MEGAIAMGIESALTEEITFEKGEIFDKHFDNYNTPALFMAAQDRGHNHRDQ